MNFNKRKIFFALCYTISSIWGIIEFAVIRLSPYDTSNLSIGGLIGLIFADLLLTTGPLGLVFALDRHFKPKEKQNVIQ